MFKSNKRVGNNTIPNGGMSTSGNGGSLVG